MSKSLKIAHRGSNNTRVELPDQTTTVVPNEQLPLWELVHLMANDTLPAPKEKTHEVDPVEVREKKYLRVRRTGKYNVCLILPDYSKITVPITDLSNWEQVEDPNLVKEEIMEKKYIRIKHRGKLNFVLELLDHSTIKITKDELSQWEQVVEEKEEIPKQYLRIRRTGKFNVGVELPDHTFYKIPLSDFPNWECIGNNTDMENKSVLEKKYIGIKHRGKNNYRVELPDHSLVFVPKDEFLSEWTQVENPDSTPVKKEYIRVLRSCKKQVRIELPDHTDILIPREELSEWKELYTLPFAKTENNVRENRVSSEENKKVEDMSEEINSIFESPILESNTENKKVEVTPSVETKKEDKSGEVVMDPILGLSVVKDRKTKIDEVGEFENTQENLTLDSLVVENNTESVEKEINSISDDSEESKNKDDKCADTTIVTNSVVEEAPKKKRGRPKKVVEENKNNNEDDNEDNSCVKDDNVSVTNENVTEENKNVEFPVVEEAPKKKRGRPKKVVEENNSANETLDISNNNVNTIIEENNSVVENVNTTNTNNESHSEIESIENNNSIDSTEDSIVNETPKKKRGRPRKNPVENNKSTDSVDVHTDVEDTNNDSNLENNNSTDSVNDEGVILDASESNSTSDQNDSNSELNNEEAPKKKRGRPRKNSTEPVVEKKKRAYTQRKINGLSEDHPYESVNMDVEPVEYSCGVEAPF